MDSIEIKRRIDLLDTKIRQSAATGSLHQYALEVLTSMHESMKALEEEVSKLKNRSK